jgi:hypothetical protein
VARRKVKKLEVIYYQEPRHQGQGNAVFIPSAHDQERDGLMCYCERLGSLLKYYTREDA